MLVRAAVAPPCWHNIRMHNKELLKQPHMNTDEQQKGKKEEGTPIYFTEDSTLQTPAEHRHDKSIDPREDDSREASKDDLRETKSDRLAGSDRAGTFERKDNSMDAKDGSY